MAYGLGGNNLLVGSDNTENEYGREMHSKVYVRVVHYKKPNLQNCFSKVRCVTLPLCFLCLLQPLEKRKKRYARTTFSYVAKDNGELSLEVGDIVEVLDEDEHGWWSGVLRGKKGVFPNNFVVEITEEEAMAAKKKQETPATKPEGRC